MSSLLRLKHVLLLLLLAALIAPGWATAQAGATLAVQAPAERPTAGVAFTTPVTIASASDVLGFQCDVEFDPAMLAVESVVLGPFLDGAGGSAQPLGPDWRASGDGKVTFGGYTLGQAGAPGAGGDGVLAVITWQALQPGTSTISLGRTLLAGPGGRPLPATVSSPLTVTVARGSGFPWLWAGLAAAALLFGVLWRLAQRRRHSQPAVP